MNSSVCRRVATDYPPGSASCQTTGSAHLAQLPDERRHRLDADLDRENPHPPARRDREHQLQRLDPS
jgi:hypothetical protein